MKSDFTNILYTFFSEFSVFCIFYVKPTYCVVWRGRRRKKGGLLTNIFVVFSVQNPFKVHEKTRCVCRTVRTVSQTWALAFFWTISMQFQRKKKKKKNAVNLILCTSFFIILFNFKFMSWFNWAKICQHNTKWASCEQRS